MKKTILALMLFVLTITSVFAQQLTDGFETWPSPNWNLIDTGSATNPITQSNTYANTGTYSLRFSSFSSDSSYDQYMVSNEINWTDAENEFSFYHRKYTSGSESIAVGWSTTGNDVETDFTWTETIYPTTSWTQYLNTTLPAETKYVAIHYFSNYAYYCYIDDVVLGNFVAGTPDAPTLVSPVNGTTNVAIDTNLEWTEGENTDHAVLYLADNEDFTGATIVDPATSPYTSSLDYSTTYFWKVEAIGPTDLAVISEIRSFTTVVDPNTPDIPELTLPSNGALNVAIDTNLEWTNGSNTDYAVLYLAENAELTDAIIVNPATSPYTSSLTNGTTYFWKVVAVGPTAIETESEVYSFTTAYPVISEFPWFEDFEDDDLNWAILDNNEDNDKWVTNYTSNTYEGSQVATITTDYNAGGNDDYLITPQLTLTGNERLKFWQRVQSAGEPNDFQVVLSTSGSGAEDFTEIVLPLAEYSNTTYQEITVDLSAYSGNCYLAFHVPAEGLDGWRLYIDNVTVEELPQNPVVEINTDPIAFGTISLNESSEEEIVSLQNIGGGSLNITDISITGTDADQFAYTDSEDYALTATEELLVSITFNPTSAGEKTATLQITDDLAREVYEIALSGTGIDTNIYEINIPYSQDFETEEGFFGWTSNLTSTSSYASAGRYSSSYSANNGTYSYRAYNAGDSSALAELISPVVVPDMDAYRLRFWAKRSGTPTLILGKYNQAMDSFTAIDTLDLTTTYAEYSVEMEVPVRANERIAFKTSFSSTYQYLYIDDLTLEEIPQGTLINITPESYDFQDVFLANEASQTFTVANNGAIAATITEFETPAGYSYDTAIVTPYTLEVGSSFDVEVTFAPQAEMIYAGNLVVKELDPNNPFVAINHEVALTGTGIPIPEGDTHDNPFIMTLGDSVTVTGSTTPFQTYYPFCSSQSVVYQLTLPTDKLMSVSLEGTAWDTKLWIFNSYDQIDQAISNNDAWYYNDDESSASTGGDRAKARDRATWSEMLETYTPAGEYYIVVAGYSSNNGDYTLTVETADIPLPAAVSNPSPADEAIDLPTSLTLTWTNPEYTDNIDLYFGTPDNMTLVLDNVLAVEEYEVTDLDPSTVYNWKVIARNVSGTTPVEEQVTWSFTTIGNAPDAVAYTSPADEATDVALNGNLSWQAATGATGYYVYLSTDNTFAGVTPVDQIETTYAYSGLDYSTSYYWKVIPYNVVGQATEGIEVWSFTTIPDPTIPMPIMVDFEGSTSTPQAITEHNFIIGTDQHNTVGNVMYKNIYSTDSNGYIQFQSMNNINASAEITLDYRLTNWSAGTVGITSVDGHDYLTVTASTDNGATFNPIASVNGSDHIDTADFTTFTTDISAFAGQSVIFRFEMLDDDVNDYWFDIDNIYFGEPASTPVASLNATEIDFGLVNVGQTASDNVIISNIGVGTLNISTIEIVGDNATDFAYSTDPEASMALGEDQSLVISLDFTPSVEGVRNATLQITDDLGRRFRVNTAVKNTSNNRGVNEVALSGEGYIPPQGSVCSNPLPLEFPVVDVTGNTADYGDDYGSTMISPSSSYLNGDDVVYQFTFDTDVTLDGTITATTGSWIGAFILDEEPNADNPPTPVNQNTTSSTVITYTSVEISAGTYYLILSTYPSPQSFAYEINLTASPLVVVPEIPTSVSISADGAIVISWEAAANANSYNVYACDTPDGDYDEENPIASVSELSYTYTGTENMKFFRVTASSDVIETPAKGLRRQ